MKYNYLILFFVIIIFISALFFIIPNKEYSFKESHLSIKENLSKKDTRYLLELYKDYLKAYYTSKDKKYLDKAYQNLNEYVNIYGSDSSLNVEYAKIHIILKEYDKAARYLEKNFKENIYSVEECDLYFNVCLWGNFLLKKYNTLIKIIDNADSQELLIKIINKTEFSERVNLLAIKKLFKKSNLNKKDMEKYFDKLMYYAEYDLILKNLNIVSANKQAYYKIKIYTIQGDYNKALEILKQYPDYEKEFKIYFYKKDYNKAINIAFNHKEILKDKVIADICVSISRSFYLDNYPFFIKTAYKNFPDSRDEYVYYLYLIYLEEENYDQAFKYLNEYLQTNKDDTEMYYFMVNKGKYNIKKVVEYFETLDVNQKRDVYQLYPELYKYIHPEDIFDDNDIIGEIYYENKNIKEALKYFKKSSNHRRLTEIYISNSDYNSALGHFNLIKDEELKITYGAEIYLNLNSPLFIEYYYKIKNPDFYMAYAAYEFYRKNNDKENEIKILKYIEQNFSDIVSKLTLYYLKEEYEKFVFLYEDNINNENLIPFIQQYIEALYILDINRMYLKLIENRSYIPDNIFNYYSYLFYFNKNNKKKAFFYAKKILPELNWYDKMMYYAFNKKIKAMYETVDKEYTLNKDISVFKDFYNIQKEIISRDLSVSYETISDISDISSFIYTDNKNRVKIYYKHLNQKNSGIFQKYNNDLFYGIYRFNENNDFSLFFNDNSDIGFIYKEKLKNIDFNMGINITSEQFDSTLNNITEDYLSISYSLSETKYLYSGLTIKYTDSDMGRNTISMDLYNEFIIDTFRSWYISDSRTTSSGIIDINRFNDNFNDLSPLSLTTRENYVYSLFPDNSNDISIGYIISNINRRRKLDINLAYSYNSFSSVSGLRVLFDYIDNKGYHFSLNAGKSSLNENIYNFTAGRYFE